MLIKKHFTGRKLALLGVAGCLFVAVAINGNGFGNWIAGGLNNIGDWAVERQRLHEEWVEREYKKALERRERQNSK